MLQGQQKNHKKYTGGFAVLFSVLLASFLITLGISIFSISLKEIQITTSVRDSQVAYYAADSARECAIYWDVKKGAYPTCLDTSCSSKTTDDQINTITCNGINIPVTLIQDTLGLAKFSTPIIPDFFRASSTSFAMPASDIRITKIWENSGVTTKIETWGHNTQILGRRVERGMSQTYR